MSKAELQALLHKEIDNSDEEMLSLLYSILQEHHHQPYALSEERMRIVEEERAKYLRGEGRSYSWDEVKQMAKEKRRPGDL